MPPDMDDRDSRFNRQVGDAPRATGGVCALSASPFTADELALLDQFRALKQEWRGLTGQLGEPPADTRGPVDATPTERDRAACQARLQAIDEEANRLRTRVAAARRRRMIALGHLAADDGPIVSADELRAGRPGS